MICTEIALQIITSIVFIAFWVHQDSLTYACFKGPCLFCGTVLELV